MEDWFPEVHPRLRRQINKWAHHENLLITGFRERWNDFLSHFRRSTRDLANPRVLGAVAKRKHYLAENPYNYSLATAFDALYAVSRMLLGRLGGKPEDERAVSDALRRRDPFAYEYLSHFAHYDETLRSNFAYLELAHDKGTEIEVAALARITRETYRLALTTEQVGRAKVGHVLAIAHDVLLAYGKTDAYGLDFADAEAIFTICLDSLQRFKLELYPVVLRAISTFAPYGDQSPETEQRIFEFLGLKAGDVLTVRGFYEEEARRKEQMLAEQQRQELEKLEREKEAGFGARFAGVLSILAALFPDSGIADLERQAYLVPYFDERVFINSLTFDHGTASVEKLSHDDPIQPVLVLHRIVDNLLNALDHVRLEVILGRDDVAAPFAEIKAEWAATYTALFTPYLRSINEYDRGISDQADAARFAQSAAGRRLEEEINQLRNRIVRNYGHAVLRDQRESTPRLWSLVERLTLLLDGLGDELHPDLAKRSDPVGKRIYDQLGREPVVDFREHATPGTPSFKPVIRQLRRYLEAKYHSSLAAVPRVAQLFLVDILRGLAELYRFALNDESSFLRTVGGRVSVAGEVEAAVWKRERDSRSGDLTERLRIRLDEHLISEYTDTLTGMKTKNFFLQKLPDAWKKLAASGKPAALLLIDIDHFKWVNDELGHQKGDEVLNDAATTVLDGVRRGSDLAIRYGGEELLVVTPAPLANAVALAERLRFTQEAHIRDRDLYTPIASISEEQGEPCGTFSLGVVERQQGESLDACMARADAALYESKKSRNSVTIGRIASNGKPVMESYASYAARLRGNEDRGTRTP